MTSVPNTEHISSSSTLTNEQLLRYIDNSILEHSIRIETLESKINKLINLVSSKEIL